MFGGYAYLAHTKSDSGNYEAGAYAGAALNNIPVFYTYKPEIKNAKLQIEQAQINYESAKNKVKKLQKVNKGVIDQGFFEIVINVTK